MLAPMQQPFRHVHPGPDLILTRAAVLVLVIWCVSLGAAGVMLNHAMQQERGAAATALRSEAIAGRAGALLGGLEMMARLPSRDVPEAVRTHAARDAQALADLLADVPGLPADVHAAVGAALQLALAKAVPGTDVTAVRDRMAD